MGGEDRRSAEAAAYRRLYSGGRWAALRKAVLMRDAYACQWPGCGKLLTGNRYRHSAPVVHHCIDHKGDPALFFDPRNLMSVCKACHDRQAQRTAHTGFITGNDADGFPLDPSHPWAVARRNAQ